MKTIVKILKWLGIVIAVFLILFFIFIQVKSNPKFDAPYPEISASTDSTLIARGKYLVYGPAHCAHCHAPTSEFVNVEQGEEVPLSGGFDFVLPIGTLYSPNITPHETGIGEFTDKEIARSMRHGVKKNGEALMDFMPFYDLGDEDLTSILSYLRTTEPVKNLRPKNDWNLLGKIIWAIGGIKPMGDGEIPPVPEKDSTALYGQYLAQSVANCMGCHTNRNLQTGGWIGEYYSGGFPMEMIDENGKVTREKHVISPNLTPDPETGIITNWSQNDFLQRFRKGRIIAGSPMPWGPFSKMSDLEIVAIYKFLSTLQPVSNMTPRGVQEGPPPGY